jgi:hypothetical protein
MTGHLDGVLRRRHQPHGHPQERWISGAWAWTTSKRESFATDLSDPELWAVTDNVNESKGDKSPDAWKPPLTGFSCTYSRA